MDGLSAAVTVVGLIEVTAKLIAVCWQYKGVKTSARDSKALIGQLEGLKGLLVTIDEILDEDQPNNASRRVALTSWASSERLEGFYEALQGLSLKLQPAGGLRAARDVLLFPLKQRDLEDTLREIERMKTALTLALSVDQTVKLDAIEAGVQEIREEQFSQRDDQRIHAIQSWLAAPRVDTNQARKTSERQDGTGAWLLHLDIFTDWLVQSNTLFWLHGIPGSGKSVLCSTVINHVQRLSSDAAEKILIYFYFDFSDDSKRSTENLTRSLISQLSSRKPYDQSLNETWKDSRTGKHAITQFMLLGILFSLLEHYIDVVIVVDAIDEAEDPQAVMKVIGQIHDRKISHVHIMLSSRWTHTVEVTMRADGAYTLELDLSNVESDISTYVFETVSRCQNWDEATQTRVSELVISRAEGMFRLARCLLDLVETCRTRRHLDSLLRSLPPGLNAVYERILLEIPDHERDVTRRMLEWLAFCGRPTNIGELTHAMAVDHPDLKGFSYDDLDIAPFESPLLCSSLVTKAQASIHDVHTTPAYYSDSVTLAIDTEFEEIRLAHASVRDFLLEDAIRHSAAKDFYLDAQLAHRNIAETCVLYLLTPELAHGVVSSEEQRARLIEWPLLLYAANFWPEHANLCDKTFRDETWELIKKLFESRHQPLCGSYGTWASTLTPNITYQKVKATTPWYYAASFGVTELLFRLYWSGAHDFNQPGGRFETTPLQVAAYRGRLGAVKYLLAAGADPNTADAATSTLCWAIFRNHEAVAEALINYGACVQEGEWEDLFRYDSTVIAARCYQLWRRKHHSSEFVLLSK